MPVEVREMSFKRTVGQNHKRTHSGEHARTAATTHAHGRSRSHVQRFVMHATEPKVIPMKISAARAKRILDSTECARAHSRTPPPTMVNNSQKYRLEYWATRSSVRSFARTAHSFACSGLLASLAPSAALTCSLACSLRSLPRSWDSE